MKDISLRIRYTYTGCNGRVSEDIEVEGDRRKAEGPQGYIAYI